MRRIQVLLEEGEQEHFRPQAGREGRSRSAGLRPAARACFEAAVRDRAPLATSAEVLQDLPHAYRTVARRETLDAALELGGSLVETVWPVEQEDVLLARSLVSRPAELGARDLLHLARCRRRGIDEVKSFDRPPAAAFRRK